MAVDYNNADVLTLLKNRNRQVQEEVYKAEKMVLEKIAGAILRSSIDAEQLVADVFTDFLFHYVDGVQQSRSIRAYLQMMTRRRAIRAREKHLSLVPLQPELRASNSAKDPEERIDDRLWRQWLDICLRRVRSSARKILKLHFGHGESYSTIGDHLGVTKQAVGKAIKKNLQVLNQCIKKHRADYANAR